MMHFIYLNVMGNQKFNNFKIQDGKWRPYSKLKNCDISETISPNWLNFPWWHILVLESLPAHQNFQLLTIPNTRHFWKLLNAISQQLFEPILMTFGTAMQICYPGLIGNQKFKYLKIKDGTQQSSWKLKNCDIQNRLANFPKILYDTLDVPKINFFIIQDGGQIPF